MRVTSLEPPDSRGIGCTRKCSSMSKMVWNQRCCTRHWPSSFRDRRRCYGRREGVQITLWGKKKDRAGTIEINSDWPWLCPGSWKSARTPLSESHSAAPRRHRGCWCPLQAQAGPLWVVIVYHGTIGTPTMGAPHLQVPALLGIGMKLENGN